MEKREFELIDRVYLRSRGFKAFKEGMSATNPMTRFIREIEGNDGTSYVAEYSFKSYTLEVRSIYRKLTDAQVFVRIPCSDVRLFDAVFDLLKLNLLQKDK